MDSNHSNSHREELANIEAEVVIEEVVDTEGVEDIEEEVEVVVATVVEETWQTLPAETLCHPRGASLAKNVNFPTEETETT